MQFGTWTVQGLRSKLDIIVINLENLELVIVTLIETKKNGCGCEIIGNYFLYYSGEPRDQHAKRGVSVLIKNKLKKPITQSER